MRGMNLIAGLVIAAGASVASAETIYGVTDSHLVKFDTANPGAVTVVGAHGFGGANRRLFNLAYNKSDGYFYAIGWENRVGDHADQFLARIDPATGAGSVAANLGNSANAGYYEGIDWNDKRGSLTVANGGAANGFDTVNIYDIATNGRDNDFLVYDSKRDLTHVWDPNGLAQWTKTDLGTGNNVDLGAINNLLGEGAYSANQDAFFCYLISSAAPYSLIKITTDGIVNITTTNEGFINMPVDTGALTGLAFIPTPGTLALLGLGALAAARRRR